ncbi:MAG TPA: 6-carboxytetrahydropterin synthase [Acidobacteriaceae bacterium]|jgi:6-pyruvoyltetrahydropterin/6-carboxytetrahydropterin synthase|nr:6-carboxytetrahydropterin synthase [Acidobacteriaceae bacterium]
MKAYLGRRYHFAASHRLHTDVYDEARNRDVYGKCNNPHGHGHNYTVEVVVAGEVDAKTGMVCDLAELDAFAGKNILQTFDHMNLNTLENFEHRVPTTENLCIEVYNIFKSFRGARLDRVRVEETNNNSFEYAG